MEREIFQVKFVNGPFDGRYERLELDLGERLPHVLERGFGYRYELSQAKPELPCDALYVFQGNES